MSATVALAPPYRAAAARFFTGNRRYGGSELGNGCVTQHIQWDRANFVYRVLSALHAGQCVKPAEGIVSPTYVPDLVHATLDLLVDGERGVWHLANQGMTSWAELAERTAAEAGLPWQAGPRVVEDAAPLTALTSERGLILPSFESAISRYIRECEVDWRAQAFLEAAE